MGLDAVFVCYNKLMSDHLKNGIGNFVPKKLLTRSVLAVSFVCFLIGKFVEESMPREVLLPGATFRNAAPGCSIPWAYKDTAGFCWHDVGQITAGWSLASFATILLFSRFWSTKNEQGFLYNFFKASLLVGVGTVIFLSTTGLLFPILALLLVASTLFVLNGIVWSAYTFFGPKSAPTILQTINTESIATKRYMRLSKIFGILGVLFCLGSFVAEIDALNIRNDDEWSTRLLFSSMVALFVSFISIGFKAYKFGLGRGEKQLLMFLVPLVVFVAFALLLLLTFTLPMI